MAKRQIEIRFRKPVETDGEVEDEFDNRIDHIFGLVQDFAAETAKYVAGYIILDTIRKTIIAKASRPVIHL